MIISNASRFAINTPNTTYLMERTSSGHLKHLYYGPSISQSDINSLDIKTSLGWGCSVLYDKDDPSSSLHTIPLEWSGNGCGDYRESPIELEKNGDALSTDFRYQSHKVYEGKDVPKGIWPQGTNADEALEIQLVDPVIHLKLCLFWVVYKDVICRKSVLINESDQSISIKKMMSFSMDIVGDYNVLNLHGDWIREVHVETSRIGYSRLVNESLTGFSSNQHNPAFAIFPDGTDEWNGECYGFNLIYSGNHYASMAKSSSNITRVMQGISPSSFSYSLAPSAQLETPDAVLTFSPDGFNGMSHNMHSFVLNHLIPVSWRDRERPVLYNDWEGCMFDFTERKLLSLAKDAKKLGCELFVLDDGWFGARNSDKSGLGDYNVNHKKLPNGLNGLADKIEKLGLKFGLWFEPEAVNEDSELYRAHPDWVLRQAERDPLQGRNEYLLDLRMECVRDYIVKSVSDVLDSASISYVKWDMNRHSNILGSGSMEYIRGLYEVFHRIFDPRPDILLETCASGGNRFDLGMLSVSPQIWASDNTDPIERLSIQRGYSYFYPQSSMGCHVSASPHLQTLRRTDIETRANVSFFGVFGYELDLDHVSNDDKKKISEQIKFYKKYRHVFQFGAFSRYPLSDNQEQWQVSDGDTTICGVFRKRVDAAPGYDKIRFIGLDNETIYHITTRPHMIDISQLGGTVNYVSPVKINPNGVVFNTVGQNFHLNDTPEDTCQSGSSLAYGFIPRNLFAGTGYDGNQRIVGDGGSEVYLIIKKK